MKPEINQETLDTDARASTSTRLFDDDGAQDVSECPNCDDGEKYCCGMCLEDHRADEHEEYASH